MLRWPGSRTRRFWPNTAAKFDRPFGGEVEVGRGGIARNAVVEALRLTPVYLGGSIHEEI